MGSSWDFAIPQAMQRHSGSNRSKPKASEPAPKLVPEPEPPAGPEEGASAKQTDTVKAG